MSPSKRPSLVEQVRQSLLGDLTSGKLEPGAKLANENELAERFAVSRSTIREAVGSLMDAGYLVRRHGSGTYVTALAPDAPSAGDDRELHGDDPRRPGRSRRRPWSARPCGPAEDERELLGLTDARAGDRRRAGALRRPAPGDLLARPNPGRAARRYSEEALDSSLYVILARAGHPVASATAQLIPTLAGAKLWQTADGQARHAAAAHRPGRLRRARPAGDALARDGTSLTRSNWWSTGAPRPPARNT